MGGASYLRLKTAKLKTFVIVALAVFTIAIALSAAMAKSTFAATPGGVTGPTLWLRADQGASASSWLDQSASGNNAVQGTAGNRPVLADDATNNVNFNPVMKFDGSNDFMGLNANLLPLGTSARSLIAVSKPSGLGGTNRYIISWGPSTVSQGMALGSYTTGNGVLVGFADDSATGNNFWQVGVPRELTGTWVGNGGASNLYSKTALVGGPTNQGWNTSNASGAKIGNSTFAGTQPEFWNGAVPEILVFPRALNATERQRASSYLGIKYGYTVSQAAATNYLASDNSIIWDATTNATYKNRITGIGRDDESELNQKQSKSTETGGLVTIGNADTIATTNNANATSFGADKSFLLFGDDNGSTSLTTTVPATTLTRMGRIWKTQETNTVGSVKLQIPASALGGSAPVLVQSSDATFDSTDTQIPLTVNGTNYEALVDFTSGDFFTFASFLTSPGGIPGPSLWLRADLGTSSTTDNTALNAWNDQSPQANNATQGGGASQPLFKNNPTDNINFNPVVRFDGNDQMNLGVSKLPLGTSARTQIGVGKAGIIGPMAPPNVLPTGHRYMISWGTSTTSQGSSLGAFGDRKGAFVGYRDDVATTNKPWLPGLPNEQTNVWLGNGGAASIYSKTKQMGGPVNKNWNTGAGAARIGNSAFAATQPEFWNGSESEILVYPRALSAAERQQVSSYLSVKYGYTLDQTTATNYLATDGSTIWDATANATYKNRITGIGRDDMTALTQKQSRSIEPGNLVTVGNADTIATTNTANGTTFAADRSYLIFGDDNAAVTTWGTAGTNGVPANFKRINRTWHVQETGTIGSTAVSFNVANTAANIPVALPNYYLLRDTNNNNTFTDDTPVQLFDDGTNGDPVAGDGHYSVSGINFANGEEFTIATGLPQLIVTETGGSTNVTEGGATDTFVVRLSAQPTSNVTVTFTNDNGDLQPIASVTLTPADWNIDHVVTVAALDDAIIEGAHTDNINYSTASTDANFAGLTGDNAVTVNVTDNDTAGVVVTVPDNVTSEDGDTGQICFELTSQPTANVTIALSSSDTGEATVPASITILAANWNNPAANCATVTGVNDTAVPTTDGTVSVTITTGDVTSADTNYNALDGSTVDNPVIQNQDNEQPAVIVEATDIVSGEDGATAAIRFRLTAQPTGGADVTIPLSLSDTSEGSLGGVTSITILNANWNTPAANEVTVTGVDDSLVDGDIIYQLVTGDPTSADVAFDGLTAANVADQNITNVDNDVAGVTITESAGSTNVTEGGATDTVSVVLDTQPATGNVVVLTVQPSPQVDLGAGAGVAVQLTFTDSNWNTPQNRTVIAVDDTAMEGNHSGILTYTIDAAATTESSYDTVTGLSSTTVNITDNDTATVTITKAEDGHEDPATDDDPDPEGSFVVNLSRVNTTGGPITVNYTIGGTAAGGSDYTTLSGSVDILGNEDSATIPVSVLDDGLFEGTETVVLTLSSTNNPIVTVGSPNSATIDILDDEILTVSTDLSVTTQGSETGPTAIVYTVTLSSPNDSPGPITFDINPTGGTATAGSDFANFAGGTIAVPVGATTGTLVVTVSDDTEVEAAENVQATISNTNILGGLTITTPNAVADIADNDVSPTPTPNPAPSPVPTPTPTNNDDDGDGAPNATDDCPNTPAGAQVDSNGCPIDDDQDGVFNGIDQCPNTPAGAQVDANGCPVDDDGDGVPNGIDQCPGTAAGVAVNASGCPVNPGQLFDIRLIVEDPSIASVKDLIGRVTFTSFGSVPTPVSMLFSIVDANGNVVWEAEIPDSTVIETEGVFLKRFASLAELPDGNYTLKLHTSYNNGVEDDFTAAFTIGEPAPFCWILVWLGLLVALLVTLGIMRRRRTDQEGQPTAGQRAHVPRSQQDYATFLTNNERNSNHGKDQA